MDKLIAELEQATEGSRELDCAIQKHDYRTGDINPSRYVNSKGPFWRNKYNDSWFEVAHYTTSLDAALTLVPEGWAGGGRIVAPYGPYQIELLGVTNDAGLAHGGASTPALALCMAALKARQIMERAA